MKRSEMVNKISFKLLNRHCDNPGCDFCEDTANEILKTAEAVGMLPPEIKNPRWNSDEAAKYTNHPFLEYSEPYRVNEWEPE